MNNTNTTTGTWTATNASNWTLQEKHLVIAVVTLVIAIATVLYNSIIIAAFCKDLSARNAFTYFLLNLAIGDLLFALIGMTGYVTQTLNPSAFDAYTCAIYMLANPIIFIANGYGMLLISVDRLLSVLFPLSYRFIRSIRLTIILCSISWLFSISLYAPYVIMDRLRYEDARKLNSSSIISCRLNYEQQHIYSKVVEFAGYDIPPVAMLIVNAYVFVKVLKRKSNRKKLMKIWSPLVNSSVIAPIPPEHPSMAENKEKRERSSQRMSADDVKIFRVFFLLTFSDLLCNVPSVCYFIYVDFLPGFWNQDVYTMVIFLNHFSCVFNPLIYHFGLPEMHAALNKLVGFRKK